MILLNGLIRILPNYRLPFLLIKASLNYNFRYPFGVWAGDLAYHDNTWYCYQIDYNHGLFVSTAQDIRGAWSKPLKMLSNETIIDDPSGYWDEENHEAFLICNTGTKLKSKDNTTPGNENRLYGMSWDGKQLLD